MWYITTIVSTANANRANSIDIQRFYKNINNPKDNFVLSIDFSVPAELIIKEIERIHAYIKEHNDSTSFLIGSFSVGIYSEYITIKSREGVAFDVNDNPRAVGLWLWDYLDEKFGSVLPRGAITEAVRELKQKFDLERLGYAESQQKVLEDKYRGTCRCIESCEVLPF